MTVKELKELLESVPDEVEVVSLVGGYHAEQRETWLGRYSEEDKEFILYC
jgi:fructose-bisphosphate aldolase class 1